MYLGKKFFGLSRQKVNDAEDEAKLNSAMIHSELIVLKTK